MGQRRKSIARPLVATVFGTRPQFIKLAVLWRELETQFRSILIDSGQHYDWELAGAIHQNTRLRLPDHHLGVGSANPAAQIGRIADALDSRFSRLKPNAVIVIGDTSTTAGAAIAAAYRGIPVAHVEAGLRSFDRSAPEEKNRIIADQLSRWRFCPTTSAIDHLRSEGLKDGLHGVGDLMYEHWLGQDTNVASLQLNSGVVPGEYYFVTAHRAENVDSDERLGHLVRILRSLDRPVVYAVHPRTKRRLVTTGHWKALKQLGRVHLIPPVTYTDSLTLIRNARVVLTDSGGLQREAYWSRVPCLVLRTATEWPELLAVGAGRLVGLNLKLVRLGLVRRWHITPVSDRVFSSRRPSKAIVRRLARDIDA